MYSKRSSNSPFLIVKVLNVELTELVVSTNAEAIPAHPGVELLNLWRHNCTLWLLDGTINWLDWFQFTLSLTFES